MNAKGHRVQGFGGWVRRCNELLQLPWEGSNVYFPIPISPCCWWKKSSLIWPILSHFSQGCWIFTSAAHLDFFIVLSSKVGWFRTNLEAPLHWRCSITGDGSEILPTSWGWQFIPWYPIIYRVSYIPGGCLGFLPLTVLHDEARFPESHQWGPPLE